MSSEQHVAAADGRTSVHSVDRTQPQEIRDIKKFLEYARRKDAKCGWPGRTDEEYPVGCHIKHIADVGVIICYRTAARIKVSKKSRKDPKTGLSSTVNQTKFKLRCSRYMYTLTMDDASKAEKLRQSLPPSERVQITALLHLPDPGLPLNFTCCTAAHRLDCPGRRQGGEEQEVDALRRRVGCVTGAERHEWEPQHLEGCPTGWSGGAWGDSLRSPMVRRHCRESGSEGAAP